MAGRPPHSTYAILLLVLHVQSFSHVSHDSCLSQLIDPIKGQGGICSPEEALAMATAPREGGISERPSRDRHPPPLILFEYLWPISIYDMLPLQSNSILTPYPAFLFPSITSTPL